MTKNRLDYRASLTRHRHDVSAGYTSSLAPGMIIPQYFDILGPGDKIYYRSHLFARMQDVVTAFLGEVDIHLDYFFVPLQMIYTPFGQIFAQTDDFVTSLYAGMSSRDTFPLFGIDHNFAVNTAYSSGGVPEFECEGKKIMRMLDAFDMNPYEVLHSDFYPAGFTPPSTSTITDKDCFNPPIAPWIPCAYQAIYQKYYRNDEFEKLSVDSYNVDAYYNTTSVNQHIKYFNVNWHQRPSDYFTNTRISPISSAVNKLGSSGQYPNNGGSLDSLLLKTDSFLTTNSIFKGFQQYDSTLWDNYNPTSFNTVSETFSQERTNKVPDYSLLNAANIRALFAVDKFSRIYGRADKTYDDQILAHFGVEIPHDVKHDLTHLKHYHLVIQSDPIFGTANTATSDDSKFIGTIGQVGGQGQATLDTDQEDFTAPVHGVFMAVAYVLTKPRYVNTFNKLHLCTNRLAFPIPEFDKLGAQPLYAFEFSRYYLQPDVTSPAPYSWRSVRRGWQNRYQQFKQKYNRASLVFEKPDKAWAPVDATENIYSSWVINRSPFYLDVDALAQSNMIHPTKFFENPHNLDSIMVRPYVSSWSNDWFSSPWLAFQTDPIISEFMCYAKKVSWMSETGEPDL